jgi:dienelactone hydrolase
MTGRAVAGALLVVAVSAGAASGGPQRVSVSVSPSSSLIDQPIHIRVAGLKRHAAVAVRIRATDAKGAIWHSSARFRANGAGRVDLDRARALSGSYTGVWGMGLIARLTTRAPGGATFAWGGVRTFDVSVRVAGKTVAETSFDREEAPIAEQSESIPQTGFYGVYDAPAGPVAPGPALMVFGGSESGLHTPPIAAALAGRGFATLAIAYFGEPGLPQTLSNVPLEYFAKALTWLRQQPQVDPSRVAVMGVSRGSEAALLLGVDYPDLVRGVVASVPSNVVICSFPGCSGPAWTFMGQPIPYSSLFGPNPIDNPDARIRVEKIRGAILLVCGKLDAVWPSCPASQAIMKRLGAFDDPYRHVLFAYLNAGHYVGGMLPYQIFAPPLDRGDERAREDAWPHLLSFLDGL